MPADIGTLLVRISADISELKAGAQQAAVEIQRLKEQVNDSTKSISGWGFSMSGLSGQMNTLVGGVGSFLGIAFSVYGVLRLWQSAIQGFYSLMSSAINQIDDYQRAMIGTAGMMTTITDRKYQPDLSVAYGQWKTYLQWLYDASLETDRKVAAGGAEIFEAARLMGIRGAVAKTKDDVYTVGLLVDFIKSITQGMPERQQLLQEVRSLFEGSMRPGAQALAQMEAIMPGFRTKFDEARKAAMAMGDAAPIFKLIRQALEGSTYAAADMQNTFESLYSSATSGFQKLMLEAFTPMYQKLVEYGWQIMDVYYSQGKLTTQGRAVAAALTTAWDQVKVKVAEWVDVLAKNPEVVVNIIQRVCTFLGQAAELALTAAKALESVVSAISMITSANIYTLGIALSAAAAAALLLGMNLRSAIAIAGGLVWVGSALANLNAETKKKRAGTEEAEKFLTDAEKADLKKKTEPGVIKKTYENVSQSLADIVTWDTENARKDAYRADYGKGVADLAAKKIETEADNFVKSAKDSGVKTKAAYDVWYTKTYLDILKGPGTEQEKLLKKEGLFLMGRRGEGTPEEAPDVPRVKMATGKADKKGAAGKTDEYAQLYKQLMDLESRIAQTEIDKKIASVRQEFKRMGQEIEDQWKRGELSYDEYFNKLRANIDKSYAFEKKLEEDKIAAANKTLQLQLENNRQRAANKELSDESAKVLDLIEIRKRDLVVVKAKGDLDKLAIKNAEDLIKLEEKKYQIQVKAFELAQQSSWVQKAAQGPVSEKAVAVEKMWADFYKSSASVGLTGPGTTVQGEGYGPKGKTTTTVSYDAEFLKAKEREWEIQWGQVTRDAANAISSGFEDLISGLMSGSADFKQIANKMFQNLFKAAMKPGLDALTEMLIKGFKQMFQSVGSGVGLAILGAIALIGMMLTSSKKQSSFSPSGVTSQVTGHESVRGIIAGETSIPIAQIGVSLADALVGTNSILTQIEQNTRGLGQVKLQLTIDIPGLKESVAKAMEEYFATYAQTLGSK